jgi:hypothetical protein
MRRLALVALLGTVLLGGYWLKIQHDWNHYGQRSSSRIYD